MFNPKQQQSGTPQQHFKVFLYEGSDVTLSNKSFKEEQPKSVHRFILDQFSLSFDEFVQKLKDKSIVTSTTFKLFYLDDQNDWVTLSDEEDWKVLGSILNSETVIKIVCKNVIPKNETTENPQCDFFKNFRKCHGRKQCPFGSNFNPCAGGLGAGFGRGGMEQFAPIIENVMGSLFKNPQNQQQGNPMGNIDLSSLLNTFFPGASNSAQQEPKQTNEQSTPTESNTNQQAPPQFNGLHDLINNFCGKLNGGLNNGSLNIPHFGVVCDGCGKRNFTGTRWNCGDCGDFDFCQECFDTKANDHFDGFHSFTQVEPKGKTFLDNIMKKMEEHKHASSNQQPEQDETPVASQTTPVDEKTQPLPEEQLDEQLYPTIDPVDIPSVTTSQLLSSQLDIPVEQVPEVVQQSPVEQAPPVLSFATEHQLLKDMGFDNEEVNTRLLKKYNGNVQRVITDLL